MTEYRAKLGVTLPSGRIYKSESFVQPTMTEGYVTLGGGYPLEVNKIIAIFHSLVITEDELRAEIEYWETPLLVGINVKEAELNENLDLSLAGVGMVSDDNVVREFRLTHLIATMKEFEP